MMSQIVQILSQPAVLAVAYGIFGYAVLSGTAKVVRNLTLARRIERDIINQIEDMVKAKLEKGKQE